MVIEKIQRSKLLLFDILLALGLAGYALIANLPRFLGHDYNWDLLNYHLSNVTLHQDLALHAAGVQTYFPSTLDVLTFPVHTSLSAPLTGLIMLIPFLFNFLIIRVIFIKKLLDEAIYLPNTLVAVSLMSSTAISQINNSMGDLILSPLVLLGIGLFALGIKQRNSRMIVLTAIPFGIALGLKTTYVYVLISIFIIFIYFICIKSVKILMIIQWSAIITFIYFILSIQHLFALYRATGNPVFPFANAIFKSRSYPEVNFRDNRFGLRSISDFLLTPYRLAKDGQARTSELVFTDYRLLIMLLAVVLIALLIFTKASQRKMFQQNPIILLGLIVLTCYFIWGYLFGISRYFLVVDLLIPLFACAAFSLINTASAHHKTFGTTFIVVLTILLSVTTSAVNWGFDGTKRTGVAFEKSIYPLTLDTNSAILLADQPLAFISYQVRTSANVIYLSPAFNPYNFEEQLKLIGKRTVYSARYNSDPDFIDSKLKSYGVRSNGDCQIVHLDFDNKLTPTTVYFCGTKSL